MLVKPRIKLRQELAVMHQTQLTRPDLVVTAIDVVIIINAVVKKCISVNFIIIFKLSLKLVIVNRLIQI